MHGLPIQRSEILISWESWSPAVAKTARCVCRRHLIGLQLPSTRIDKVIIYRINIILLFLQQARLDIMGENGYVISFILFAYFFLLSFRIIVSVTRVISSGQGSGWWMLSCLKGAVVTFSPPIHPSKDIYVVSIFHLLWIIFQWTWVCRYLRDTDLISFECIRRSGIAGSYHSFIFNFLRKSHTVSHSNCMILQSYQQSTGFQLLHIPLSTNFSVRVTLF